MLKYQAYYRRRRTQVKNKEANIEKAENQNKMTLFFHINDTLEQVWSVTDAKV